MEVVGHLFRSLYEQQYAICTTDFTNGFNAFARQAMLDAVDKRCPASSQLLLEAIREHDTNMMRCALECIQVDMAKPPCTSGRLQRARTKLARRIWRKEDLALAKVELQPHLCALDCHCEEGGGAGLVPTR